MGTNNKENANVEVNIGNNWDGRLLRNRWKRLCVSSLRTRHAHNIATSGCQLRNLLQS